MADYESDTTHLSLMEHGAYRLLLDHYYKKRQPLPANASLLHRICRAFASDEQAAVHTVLEEFFVLKADGYHQKRADREIDKAQEISAKRSAAANVRHKGNNELEAKPSTEKDSKPSKSADANALQMHSKSRLQKHANAVHVDTQLTTHNSQLTNTQDHNSTEKKETPSGVAAQSTGDFTIWRLGVGKLMAACQLSEQTAKGFISKQVKNYGKTAVADAITQMLAQEAIEPRAYMVKVLQNGNGKQNTRRESSTESDFVFQPKSKVC